ncbi:hypothetical protein BT93_H1934 [Corymbia citriodora subsp. variegata]|nr:hypothetical protein BT93_H1934 [Corymbia citriodora subsp. variegata]
MSTMKRVVVKAVVNMMRKVASGMTSLFWSKSKVLLLGVLKCFLGGRWRAAIFIVEIIFKSRRGKWIKQNRWWYCLRGTAKFFFRVFRWLWF